MNGIGLLGGTFDPVHFGHLRAALEAREWLDLNEFRLLPAGVPPHRPQPVAAAGHRLEMLRMAASSYPGFSVDDREIRRSGNSYMVDTLSEIRREEGDTPLLLMIGQDAVNALDSWHEWKKLFDLTHLVVMLRPDSRVSYSERLKKQMKHRRTDEPAALGQVGAGLVYELEITQLDISSSAIRRSLFAGRSPRFLMPDVVIDYIRDNHLYCGPLEK